MSTSHLSCSCLLSSYGLPNLNWLSNDQSFALPGLWLSVVPCSHENPNLWWEEHWLESAALTPFQFEWSGWDDAFEDMQFKNLPTKGRHSTLNSTFVEIFWGQMIRMIWARLKAHPLTCLTPYVLIQAHLSASVYLLINGPFSYGCTALQVVLGIHSIISG